MAADPVFLDTNVLIAASVDAPPSHASAVALLARLAAEQTPFVISSQICREFLVVLTRQPAEGRSFSVDEALSALDRWRSTCAVVSEGEAVLAALLDLVRDFEVKGKQVHDANVVAAMRANGIKRLATLNASDFQRYEEEIRVEALVS